MKIMVFQILSHPKELNKLANKMGLKCVENTWTFHVNNG
jgi:hypothetical protein